MDYPFDSHRIRLSVLPRHLPFLRHFFSPLFCVARSMCFVISVIETSYLHFIPSILFVLTPKDICRCHRRRRFPPPSIHPSLPLHSPSTCCSPSSCSSPSVSLTLLPLLISLYLLLAFVTAFRSPNPSMPYHDQIVVPSPSPSTTSPLALPVVIIMSHIFSLIVDRRTHIHILLTAYIARTHTLRIIT